jgi:hypothetical protein
VTGQRWLSVQIACKLPGFTVADGNTWWYRIEPLNSEYYASADAIYNNSKTTGSLLNTPLVDPCADWGARPVADRSSSVILS